jgi:hypothetical protein
LCGEIKSKQEETSVLSKINRKFALQNFSNLDMVRTLNFIDLFAGAGGLYVFGKKYKKYLPKREFLEWHLDMIFEKK